MATPAFDTDASKPLDNTQDPNKPLPQIAPNQVAVNPPSSDPGASAEISSAAAPQGTSGQVGASSGTQAAQGAGTTGSGPSASGAPTNVPNIPGPGSQPAASAGAAGPGSQPASVPAQPPAGGGPSTAPAPQQPPGTQVTEGANGASYVTQKAGTTTTAAAPDNSRFTDTTQNLARDKALVGHGEGGADQRAYGRGEAGSNYHRDATGAIATNENLAGPEEYTQKTSARSDGHGGYIVDYVKSDPKGKPLSPALDIKGWNSLTDEQRDTAMLDYEHRMEKWMKDTGVTKETATGLDPEFFDSDTFKSLPPEAQLEAAKAYREGRAPAIAAIKDQPKITVNADGSVSYNAVDSKGKALAPWDAPEWKGLTQDQRDSLLKQYNDNAATVAKGGTPGEDQNYLGTGMAESAFKQLDQRDQGWVMGHPGWEAPVRDSVSGSVTYKKRPEEGQTEGYSYTEDASGTKTSETFPPGSAEGGDTGVTKTYGKDNSSTTTSGGTVTKTDSQGNTVTTDENGWITTTSKGGQPVLSFAPDSKAAQSATMGFGPNGERLTFEERLAAKLGVPVNKLSREQVDSLYNGIAKNIGSEDNWRKSKVMGTLALQSGLITQEEFDAINNSKNIGSSWSAWAFANPDVARALTQAGLTDDHLEAMAGEAYFGMPPLTPGRIDEESLHDVHKGGEIPADALKGVNIGNIAEPKKAYEDAFKDITPASRGEVVSDKMSSIYQDKNLSPEDRTALAVRLISQAGYNPNDPKSVAAIRQYIIDRTKKNLPGDVGDKFLQDLQNATGFKYTYGK